MKNNYCALLWNHFIFSQDKTMTKPCCVHKSYFDMDDTINKVGATNSVLKDLRKKVLDSDEHLPGCDECYRDEKVKGFSLRTQANKVFNDRKKHYIKNTQKDGTYEDFKLEWLDIRWSNLCNYKCRFCGISSSNSWLNDHLLLDKVPENYDNKTGLIEANVSWEDLQQHLPYVRYIKLAGGEPLMMEGTYQLLEEMINLNKLDTEILINTNASFIKYGKKDIVRLLENFSKVNISLSIDGMQDVHNYLRSGKNDWKKVENNIEQFLNFNGNVSFLSSVSWLNAQHMIKVLERYKHVNIGFNSVTNPEFMSLGYLPKKQFANIIEQLNKSNVVTEKKIKYKKWLRNQYKQTRKSNTQRMQLKEQFLFFINKLDQTRGQDFCTTFPEWQSFYKEITNA